MTEITSGPSTLRNLSYLKNTFQFFKKVEYNSSVATGFENILKDRLTREPGELEDSYYGCGLYVIKRYLSSKQVDQFVDGILMEWPHSAEVVCSCGLYTTDTQILEKIRWLTMGYHYDWTNKVYHAGVCGRMSPFLADTCKSICKKLHLSDEFCPEASIVNYYRGKTTMGFHIDRSELNLDAPLVSISIGLPAYFLVDLQGSDPSVPTGSFFSSQCDASPENSVLPLILEHGDVVVMSGSCRLAPHAVPKVLCYEELLPHQRAEMDAYVDRTVSRVAQFEAEWLRNYLSTTRFNLNVRQVF